MVTENVCKLIPSSVDSELCFRRDRGELVALMTKHVDDLKITGDRNIVRAILTELQKVFGELKLTYNSFVNCGVQHTQDIRTKEITLDQVKYAMNQKTIVHPQLSTGQSEDEACPELHQLVMSLLGAVAYLAHTHVLMLLSSLAHFNVTQPSPRFSTLRS
jgi:hypothetical protein